MNLMPSFLRHIPIPLLDAIMDGRAAVVGGAIRAHFEGLSPRDVDVFVFTAREFERIVEKIGAKPIKDVAGLAYHIQTAIPTDILFVEGRSDAQRCCDAPDFDIAAGVYSEGRFVLPEGYMEAIRKRRMHFRQAASPHIAYQRFLRYARDYGYRMDDSIHVLLKKWREATASCR